MDESWGTHPASPTDEEHTPTDGAPYHFSGLTPREHAAIELRVPSSGIPELDAMIRSANRRELAGRMMAAWIGAPGYGDDARSNDDKAATYAVSSADALLTALEGETE